MASTFSHKAVASDGGFSLYYAGEVALIVMDRGENRINQAFVTGMNKLLDIVESNSSCKGLITTGKGKFYSNGLDLAGFAKMDPREVSGVLVQFVQLVKRIMMFPIPTLAAINGHAFAGGAIIAFAHDLRTMNTEKGWLCLNETFLNLQFGDFNLKFLEGKIGKGLNYSDALVLAKRYTAKEAFNTGMVHAAQPPNLLLPESAQVLKTFYRSGYPRDGLVAMKTDVYRETLQVYSDQRIDEQVDDLKRGILPEKARL